LLDEPVERSDNLEHRDVRIWSVRKHDVH
jgi:hypothetical protein